MMPIMLMVWALLAAPSCEGALMQDSKVPGSFRAGSISWTPVSPGSDTVRVTVHTAWLRSAGTFVKIVDGVARPEEGYQPRKGDVVKVLGPETPRFITFGMEKYLEVTVTSATEQVRPPPLPPSSHPTFSFPFSHQSTRTCLSMCDAFVFISDGSEF